MFSNGSESYLFATSTFPRRSARTTSDAKTLPVVASEMTQLGRDVPWGILNASVILLSLPPLLFLGVLSSFLNSALKARNQG